MVQLGFNTGISGQIKAKEMLAPTKIPPKTTVVAAKKTPTTTTVATAPVVSAPVDKKPQWYTPPVTVGIVKPKTSNSWAFWLATMDIMEWSKSNEQLTKEYSSQLSAEDFKTAVNLASDLRNGSGLDELKKAYATVDPQVLDKVAESHDLMKEIYWDNLAPEQPEMPMQSQDEWMWLGTIAAWIWAGLGWLYWVGWVIGWVGKWIYNMGLKAGWDSSAFVNEADAMANYKAWLWPKPKKIVDTALEQPWMWGSPIGISADAKRNMANLWDNKVAPVMKEITNGWWKIWVNKLESAVHKTIDGLKKIENVQGYAEELKAAVSEYFKSKVDKGITSWTIEQIQWEKTALRNFLQKKITNGSIPTDADKLVDKVVSDTYSDIVHTQLQKAWEKWKEASKSFTDYGNLKALEDTSKLYAKSPLKGWFMWVVWAAQETIGIPVATAGWKTMAKIWEAMKAPAEIVYKWLKWLGKNVLQWIKEWLLNWETPAALIMPDMLQQSYMAQWMSSKQAEDKANEVRLHLFELPWEIINNALDKALWLPPQKKRK